VRHETKNEILEEISLLTGKPFRETVAGGTILKSFFDDMADVFKVSNSGPKPEVLRRCVESVGHKWLSDFDSTDSESKGGGTITTLGLMAVRDAVIDLLAMDLENVESGVVRMPSKDYEFAPEAYAHEGEFKPGQIDPDLLGDGFERHNKTQNLLAKTLLELGLDVSGPTVEQPKFDILWSSSSKIYVGEVKSLTESNIESQLRTALGQVLRYRSQLSVLGIACEPVVIVDREVDDKSWWKVFDDSGVGFLVAPNFAGLYQYC
jgi:hypothetical protein